MKKFTFIKTVILFLSVIAFSIPAGAQVCAGNITLSTQAQVDAFACSEVSGNLEISGAGITDLSPLASLTSVGGNFTLFSNPAITSLDGLSSLTSVGGSLTMNTNSNLSNVDGLSSLSSVGGNITLLTNLALTNLDGLSSLTSVGGLISITSNSSLTNLDGLSLLTSVGGDFYIVNNTVLTEYCGLFTLLNGGGLTGSFITQSNQVNPSQSDIIAGGPCAGVCVGDVLLSSQADVNAFSCTSITGSLKISGPDITNIDALSMLTSVGGYISLENNPALTNVDGLSSITTVTDYLYISGNTSLTNLDGLSSITSVGGYLNFNHNYLLTNLDGLLALTAVGGDIRFYDFTLMNVDGLSSLTSVGGGVFFSGMWQLENINGLSSLTSVGGNITLLRNPAITNLDGLSSLASVGDYIEIVSNAVLTEFCGLFSLLNGGGFTGTYWVYNNGANPTQQDIIDGGPCLPPCDIQISVLTNAEGCPGANDGYISVDASCTTCTALEYSIDGINFQSGNTFTNLSPGSYTAYARDAGESSCIDNIGTYINPGVDNVPPVVSCKNIEICMEPGSNVMITPQDVLSSVTDNCAVDYNSLDVVPSNFSASDIFTVTLSASDYGGNTGNCNATVTVRIKSTPLTSVVASNNPICPGESVTLSASGGTPGTGAGTVWYDGPNGSGNMLGTGDEITLSPVGTTTYYVRREGICNNTSDLSITISADDVTAPVLTVISTPITLWPPNHEYETIDMSQLDIAVSDNCADLSTADVYITSVSSDEPENGDNDGNTLNDIVIGEGCQSVQLRKERNGEGNGRVYTIYLAVEDNSGNTGTASCQVHVPITNGGTAIDDGVALYEEFCGDKSSIASFTGDDIQLMNYPNPFSGSTTIAFTLTETENATLKVYDTFGKEVAILFDGMAESGQQYTFEFKGENLSKGIYVYHLQSGNNVSVVKKMTLMK